MGRARSYRELRVYREAFALAMEVFELACAFPDHEKFDLARQIKRSSRSVCANTAEAWRRRRYPGSADLDTRYDRLLARLTAMRTHPAKWVPRERARAEAPAQAKARRQRSAPAPPTPHPQAPRKKVDSDREPAVAANSAQEVATKSPSRPVDGRRGELPSSAEAAATEGAATEAPL